MKSNLTLFRDAEKERTNDFATEENPRRTYRVSLPTCEIKG